MDEVRNNSTEYCTHDARWVCLIITKLIFVKHCHTTHHLLDKLMHSLVWGMILMFVDYLGRCTSVSVVHVSFSTMKSFITMKPTDLIRIPLKLKSCIWVIPTLKFPNHLKHPKWYVNYFFHLRNINILNIPKIHNSIFPILHLKIHPPLSLTFLTKILQHSHPVYIAAACPAASSQHSTFST